MGDHGASAALLSRHRKREKPFPSPVTSPILRQVYPQGHAMDEAPDDSAETLRLLDRARAGDAAAFDLLFERHRAQVRGFLDNRIDDRLRARLDASDVVQEAQLV